MRTDWWWVEPALLIGASAGATQYATIYARKILRHQAHQLTDDPSRKKEYEDKAPGLAEALKTRNEQLNLQAYEAVDSYFNQVVGSWAFALLGVATCLALFIRFHFKTFSAWEVPAVGGSLLFVGVIAVATHEPFVNESLLLYFGRAKLTPPINAKLTWFRLGFFLVFMLLTLAAYYPKWNLDTHSTTNPPATNSPAIK
jgi:hypothetical protein